jgi:hypothetical protein
MVKRILAALLLPLFLAGASLVDKNPPIPTEPAWIERPFSARPDAVRSALAAVLQQAGLPANPDAAVVPPEMVTQWQRFQLEDFGATVAHDTPSINREYPYASPIRLCQGSYRLRARILSDGGGALLALQAELLADGYNVAEFEAQQVVRFSNGAIEDAFFLRVEETLARDPASGESD